MQMDFVRNKGTILEPKITWRENFPNRFVGLTMSDVSSAGHEGP